MKKNIIYKIKKMKNINKFEVKYRQLLEKAITKGIMRTNRTGVNTMSLFNEGLTIDLKKGFPAVTGKKVFFDKALTEYIWMMEGLVTTRFLKENGVHWWDEYADECGYLGKTYGYQIRNFNGEVDQLDYIHRQIRMNSRRAHLTLWNPSDLKEVKIPPCFTGMTFMREGNELNMQMQFRSSDLFLGLPYDIMVAALILTDVSLFNELKPSKLGIAIADAHVYVNHIDQVKKYLNNKVYKLPILKNSELPEVKKWRLEGYESGPYIKAKMNN